MLRGAAPFLGVLLGKNPPGTVTINRGKLLQHELIGVECTKKKVPEYQYPLYRSTGTRFKKVISDMVSGMV